MRIIIMNDDGDICGEYILKDVDADAFIIDNMIDPILGTIHKLLQKDNLKRRLERGN